MYSYLLPESSSNQPSFHLRHSMRGQKPPDSPQISWLQQLREDTAARRTTLALEGDAQSHLPTLCPLVVVI